MEKLLNPDFLLELGIPGLTVVLLFSLVLYLLKQASAERKEYRKDAKESSEKVAQALNSLKDVIIATKQH